MNANDLVLIFTYILVSAGVGIGIFRYGMKVGIDTVYRIKTDRPLDKDAVPTEQEDTFEEDETE